MMKKILLLLTLVISSFAFAANATSLDDAKAKGLIGEQANGYLGLVKADAPAAVKSLVKSVNAKRKAKYQQIAAKQKIPLNQVEKIAGQKAFEKTKPGHYIKPANGSWQKK